ncbi:MAG: ABC transporter permease [Bdellovibrionales bacterium]|nr:ABC transporter permease [Bdellovibrionales bacterium]
MLAFFSEAYRYRGLVAALVTRHLAARYRGSVLGFLWSFLNPLCLMLVYTLVFRYYVRFDSVDNYTIFLFCGLLPWIWLSSGLIEGTSSIVASGSLITKSLFPAHLLPIVSVLTAMIHFVLSLPLLFLFMLIAGLPFHLTLFLLPLVVLAQFLILCGLCLALSALNVYFRDVQHVVANVLNLLFFLCPIIYPLTSVPDRFQFTMVYNPFAVLTTMYQQVVLEGVFPSLFGIAFVFLFSLVVLSVGIAIFDRHREGFAELL